MKQNFPIASVTAILLIAVFLNAACVKRSRSLESLTPASPNAARSELINLNQASVEELEKLPGVGQALAQRIVAHREQYGPFRRVEHLMMVRGISAEKFWAIRLKVTVEQTPTPSP